MNLKTDILIAGGGLGGVAAALAAARMGRQVVLTEETDWPGGQLTSQLVPMDEHPWIETFGCTRSYRRLRDDLRAYYRRHYPLTTSARNEPYLNPGAALVTRLACEPKVAVAVLNSMLAPYLASGRVTFHTRWKPAHAETHQDRVTGATFLDLETGEMHVVEADYVLDATELGELLPLAGVEHTTGAESQEETGELHAVAGPAQPLNMQAITYCFALSHHPGEDHTIEKPAQYDFWRAYRADFEQDTHFSYSPRAGTAFSLFPEPGKFSLWQFRRVLYKAHFAPGFFPSDLTLMNSMHNDYWLKPILGIDETEAGKNIEEARQLSLSYLYWLQTEAPRPDGGAGFPGLRLRPDVSGTADGLAKYPYVRESRRLRAEFTVLEQHVGVEARGALEAAEEFPDSVGIGSYRIDLHPTTAGDPSLNIPSWPFQIPLGSFIPVRVENVLPAAKNLGVTHITNGCYRLHQIEWNTGEVAGTLAAYCLNRGLAPRQVRNTPQHLQQFQAHLVNLGVELEWPRFGHGTSYYKAHRDRAGWQWGETDKMPDGWLWRAEDR